MAKVYAQEPPAGSPGKRICVLSIDGGGVRGIIPSTILEFLENELKGPNGDGGALADYFDVVAGTSTGGLVAAMLTVPQDTGSRIPKYCAKDVSQTYLKDAATIFPPRSPLSSWLPEILENLCHPKYDGTGLVQTVNKLLQKDWHLKDTLTNVVIPAFDIATQEPVFFSNLQAQRDSSANPLLGQVCLGTSAAPTYLPAVAFTVPDKSPGKPGKAYNLVDGGVVCNNPAHVAVIQAIKEVSNGTAYKGRIDTWNGYQDLLVLSFGTGNMPVSYNATVASKWGVLGWAHDSQGNVPLVDVFSNGSSDMVDYNLSVIFDGFNCSQNYLRIQTDGLKGETSAMDDSSPENMQHLVDIANDLLDQEATYRDPLTGKLVPYADKRTNKDRLRALAQELMQERAARAGAQPPKHA